MLSAEIIAIGSELLTPEKTDTNGLWLTARLNDIGIEVMLKTIVGDDEARLEETLRDAIRRSDLVITTGGLGPTEDDITRKCAARALDTELVYRDEIEAALRERFRLWGREMPDINKRQAYVIQGCTVLPNPNGSAVGMLARVGEKILAVVPGPPRENQPMFLDHVLPELRKSAGDVHVRRRMLRVSGLGESAVDEIAAPIYTAYPGVRTSILFSKSEVEIHVAASSSSPENAQQTVDEVADKVAGALSKYVFCVNGDTMEAVVGRLLKGLGHTVAAAESCTGGLVSRRMTEVAGSSAYFLESSIPYSNESKQRALGVPADLIREHGAVSAECATAMATGIRERSGADHALSVTGIAGPDGGSDEKPVGTVFLGYAGPDGAIARKVVLPGDRYLIRWRASQAALDLLRRQLLKITVP